MVSDEEVEKYYLKNYDKAKKGHNLNICKKLFLDYQRLCLDLSDNSTKKISSSSRVRRLMVKDILENGKK